MVNQSFFFQVVITQLSLAMNRDMSALETLLASDSDNSMPSLVENKW